MAWDIVYFKAADGTVPVLEFLDSCPTAVEAKFEAVLSAVAEAPPPAFSGGGMWEAMHGEMTGYYEVRTTGPGREHFRLFCLLEREGPDLPGPAIAVLTGRRKPHLTTLAPAEYAQVRVLGEAYRASVPRSIAT